MSEPVEDEMLVAKALYKSTYLYLNTHYRIVIMMDDVYRNMVSRLRIRPVRFPYGRWWQAVHRTANVAPSSSHHRPRPLHHREPCNKNRSVSLILPVHRAQVNVAADTVRCSRYSAARCGGPTEAVCLYL